MPFNLLQRLTFFIMISFCLGSCGSNKNLVYFRTNSTSTRYTATLPSSNPAPLRIQSDDMLAIVVSSMSEETNSLFNSLNTSTFLVPQFSTGGMGSSQPLGYQVDKTGEVNLPLIGKLRLAGLTLKEANTYITDQVNKYVKSPTVNVRILNHKFTVMGEVIRPGIYNLSDNSATLPEVISMAGDLTLFGRRDNVKLIREHNNRREVIELDLGSQQILNSPYYYIENNDIIYVEARSTKTFVTERSVQLTPIVLSVASIAVLLINLFR